MSTVNPNRQRLLSPLDYLAVMAGYTPPEPEPPMMPSPYPVYDAQFRVQQPSGPPMPFMDQPMPNPSLPALPGQVSPWG